MPEIFTYADAGVDRDMRARSKKALGLLEKTYKFSRYGRVVRLPYGNIFPLGEDRYLDLVIEGVGTKVLVAQLAEKYDTVGIDGVAMAVNDVIRSGARPLAVVDNIHAHVSDPELVEAWVKGLVEGAEEAEAAIIGGEIGDVSELIKGLIMRKGFDMVVAALGEIPKHQVISGRDIRPGDVVIGLRSSGIHSNGISLARKILFKAWGGKYDAWDIPEELNREIVYEVLEPTRIYVKSLHEAANKIEVKAAVHITGDSYLKFDRLAKFSENIGFELNSFDPQPIFRLIQKTASELGGKISDEEMFKTFNMGWGFAIIVSETRQDETLSILEKTETKPEKIGIVTSTEGVRVVYQGRRMILR
ncbi:phosphoribosylformylglycinamidine cyclo-ligase [Candidatus Bathyarchaeota archaeon]|nr:phosphoribosylformylglycinamidine cyclo-ligase [Candidatus Bathyarchaeota archaeon]